MKAYLGVARANFLLLPVTLVAVGAAAAAYDGAFDRVATVAALLGLVALHAAVNAFNEYSDFRRGIDLETERTPFTGGSGTLPGGEPARIALGVGIGGTVFGAIVGAYFLYSVGLRLLPVYILGALCVLGYTDFLARIYLGEIFAGLGLGTLPVLGAAMVQGGESGADCHRRFDSPVLHDLQPAASQRVSRRGSGSQRWAEESPHPLWTSQRGRIYVLAGWLTKISLLVPVLTGTFPLVCLLALLPSAALIPPTRWALTQPAEPVPVPALGANVIWNLATNVVLALCLALACL